MKWIAILACLLAAVTLSMVWLLHGAGTSRSGYVAGPARATWQPTATPDNRIETSIALQLTQAPTMTWTPRPVVTPKPTATLIPTCGAGSGMCRQGTATSTATRYPTIEPPPTLMPCGTPYPGSEKLPERCMEGE